MRFRAKIMLGFAVVLAITVASMGFAYLGFEGVSGRRRRLPEGAYAQARVARNIDRELISYRGLARDLRRLPARKPTARPRCRPRPALKDAIDQAR